MTSQGMGPGLPYPPPPPPFNPWAPPPSGPPASRRSITRRVVVLTGAALAVALLAGYGLGASRHLTTKAGTPARPLPAQTVKPAPVTPAPVVGDGITAHSRLTATSGSMFFTDSFHDASQGWDTGGDKDVTTRISDSGYQTTLRRNWIETIPSPYENGVQQLGQSVTARLGKGFGSESAVGLGCERDFGESSDLAYQFIVDSTGTWSVYRLNHANLPSSNPHLLDRGQTTPAGIKAITVGVDCITLSDHRTNRLLLFVNGVKAVDLTNVTPVADEGWGGEMLYAGDDSATTVVTASRYTESTLDAHVAVGTAT